ncbi:alpha/beta hydrolase-fold protein [Flavobacterium lindanitolerans]|uniref:alpha/beta hydrolase n=1 Tax=Flavobacterium lindanitolerans TaxID=428988 RepID=UPI0028070DBE|nr:alpha/beta hydrolase-fold protein [Flavobacterium lindanitolerans]MDQ7960910.1 alpha/beta hydrolase-fold protein [Flavobacterium lindanitolerans]
MQYVTLLGDFIENAKKTFKTGWVRTVSKGNIFLFIQLFACNFCFSQSYSHLSISDTITIHSKVFDAKRKVIITKPSPTKTEEKQSNYIVYMDADDQNINGSFLQSANNLIANKEIPQSYLIGIIHKDRNTELLEKDKLLNFLKEELIPLLEDKYGKANKITIAGHSFGGYFATYAFLKDNDVFNSCIAISPAYWPNKNDVIELLLEKASLVHGSFYLAVGDKRWDEISLRKNVFKVQKTLRNQKNLSFGFNDLTGFAHNATPVVGFGLGLSFVYDEWEWMNILEEQDNKLKQFPDFWGYLEIKADALFHLKRISEAKSFYQEALKNTAEDKHLSKSEMREVTKRLRTKIKKCSKILR